MKRKKVIKKKIDTFKETHGIIAKSFIGWALSLTRSRWIYTITVPNNKEYDASFHSLENIINLWHKLPRTKEVNDNRVFAQELIDATYNKNWERFYLRSELSNTEVKKRYDRMVEVMNKSFVSESEFKELLDSVPPKTLKDLEAKKGWHWGQSDKNKDRSNMKRLVNKIGLSVPPKNTRKEVSLLRGKRINRGYVVWTDYRSLTKKVVDSNKKPKLFILLDWSGSMDSNNARGNTFYTEAVNFTADLFNTNVFDIEAYLTDSNRVTNIIDDIEDFATWKTKKFFPTTGSEWFPYLTDRLWDLLRDEDYVLILTDMYVPTDAEDNLRAFIWWKKHLILSFWAKKQFQSLNVRFVQEVLDMKNVITTLLW